MAWSEWPMRYRDIMCYPHSTAVRDSVKRVLFGHLKTLKTPSKENYCSAEEFSTRTAQIFLEGQGTLWTWFPGSFSFWESNRLKDSFPGIFCCHDKIDNDQLNQKWVSTKKRGKQTTNFLNPRVFLLHFLRLFWLKNSQHLAEMWHQWQCPGECAESRERPPRPAEILQVRSQFRRVQLYTWLCCIHHIVYNLQQFRICIYIYMHIYIYK